MKVLKFGGSSVGYKEGIVTLKKIVESQTDDVIVVVSALCGVTDGLILMAKTAAAGDRQYEAELEAMLKRHEQLIRDVIALERRRKAYNQVRKLFGELKDIMHGLFLLHDLSNKTMDTILSYGERLSTQIVVHLVDDIQLYDARQFIKTEHSVPNHTIDIDLTYRLIRETFQSEFGDRPKAGGEEVKPKRALVPGFISSDAVTGEITNLGRGGSDYTASLIAAALDADVLEIWTDVNGFMTADPHVISGAYTIDELSYAEAMELCNFGAKVIYPPTIYPVCRRNIPILVKNTFNPTARGTEIVNELPAGTKAIKGISSIDDTALITIRGLGMVGVIGVNYRIFKTLAENGISVFLVSQASSENSTSIGVRNIDAAPACELLNREFSREIALGAIFPITAEMELATVAIVGENMKRNPGIAGKLFGVLGRNGINVIACAQGASETNISFVVQKESLRKSLNVIHDSFFLSEYQVLNLFICGVGTVGSSLLEQIRRQREKLMHERSLKLNVVGIARGRKALFNREGICLDNYREQLEKAPASNTQILRDEVIRMNIFNSVFVDCTASADVAGLYLDFLDHNISVVAANKVAASEEYDKYLKLKNTARRRGIKFLFETNVGAGLPIINTINDLINSGDRILRIEAVVSGTLNFIFNNLSADCRLSDTIRLAKEKGYSEPDPRIDLSGKDVIRKLVILARESGYKLEQSDVECDLFIPQNMFEGKIEDFWKRLPQLDAEFEERRKRVEKEGKRMRFVARLENGKGSVSLCEVNEYHPFYNLQGSNNIFLLTTERYKEYPMMIQGYGAGAAVTAAGVFADIMRIANI
ncbi:MAG: bifunctional aspartate kinase/homoserine dehydrogenase I [Bacteroidaceae bacterium]|nr:MAG: Bifunctional aspartokinase/homoserine dehydrogenase 1 [Bacteroidetes bacterium ADurb.BinA104]HOD69125.1 bifunctional aspartate kinase/homoserine dehydrogenase I [Bacteroidaceae bacterium]HQL26592.1 bifunctional aspartate kinase/homoserine dehydrogenase I [Bacteroidaceae bacterium]